MRAAETSLDILSHILVSVDWSLILFVIFMGKDLSECRDLRNATLLFADCVVLFVSSDPDLQHAKWWFATECEVAGMKVTTSIAGVRGHGSLLQNSVLLPLGWELVAAPK